jgi:hypothetical protein
VYFLFQVAKTFQIDRHHKINYLKKNPSEVHSIFKNAISINTKLFSSNENDILGKDVQDVINVVNERLSRVAPPPRDINEIGTYACICRALCSTYSLFVCDYTF